MADSDFQTSNDDDPEWFNVHIKDHQRNGTWLVERMRAGRLQRMAAHSASRSRAVKEDICVNCRKINFEYLYFGNPATGYRDNLSDKVVVANLDQIDATASLGCPLCKHILQPAAAVVLNQLNSKYLVTRDKVDIFLQATDYMHPDDHELDERDHGYSALRVWIELKGTGKTRMFECESYILQLRDHPLSRYRSVPLKANLELCRPWYNECHSNHDQCLTLGRLEEDSSGFDNKFFKLINVESCCIVGIADHFNANYATLSYMWGNLSKVWKLLKNSGPWKRNAEGNPTLPLPSGLPLTILDAIAVTRALGLQYLWIDAICVTQDDPEEMKEQIHSMDSIYATASICIIAAPSHQIGDGLPGISLQRPEEPEQQVNIKEGLTIGCQRPKFDHVMQKTPYMDRGWTFQELLLSKRCLMFTQHQIYFFCAGMTTCESTYTKTEENFASIWAGQHLGKGRYYIGNSILVREQCRSENHERIYQTWAAAVCEYSRRQLTFQTDGLNAFQGLARFIGKHSGDETLFGCQRRYLVNALGWRARPVVLVNFSIDPERRLEVSSDSVSRPLLPSWTWASYTGFRAVAGAKTLTSGSEMLIMSSQLVPEIPSTANLEEIYMTSRWLRIPPVLTPEAILPTLTKIATFPVMVADEEYPYIFDIDASHEFGTGSRCEADRRDWKPRESRITCIQLYAGLRDIKSAHVVVLMIDIYDLPEIGGRAGSEYVAEAFERNNILGTASSLSYQTAGTPTKLLQPMTPAYEGLRISAKNFRPIHKPILATRAGYGFISLPILMQAEPKNAIVLLG